MYQENPRADQASTFYGSLPTSFSAEIDARGAASRSNVRLRAHAAQWTRLAPLLLAAPDATVTLRRMGSLLPLASTHQRRCASMLLSRGKRNRQIKIENPSQFRASSTRDSTTPAERLPRRGSESGTHLTWRMRSDARRLGVCAVLSVCAALASRAAAADADFDVGASLSALRRQPVGAGRVLRSSAARTPLTATCVQCGWAPSRTESRAAPALTHRDVWHGLRPPRD